MKHLVRWTILLVLVGMVIYLAVLMSKPHDDPYSFSAYHRSHHIPVPMCSLQVKQSDGSVVKCAETGEAPTRAQVNVWEGYVLWVSCREYNVQPACDQLND